MVADEERVEWEGGEWEGGEWEGGKGERKVRRGGDESWEGRREDGREGKGGRRVRRGGGQVNYRTLNIQEV